MDRQSTAAAAGERGELDMIRTKAAYTTNAGICEGGMERTMAALEKHGLGLHSWVTMQLILRELGLSDTLFSFCKVKKGDEPEARRVLRHYMGHVAATAYRFIWVADPSYVDKLNRPIHAIDKRVRGHDRRALFAAQYKDVAKLHKEETRPQIKHWLHALMCLLSEYGDHLCATHASIALMDGADIVGIRKEVHGNLVHMLSELLGPEDGRNEIEQSTG